MYRISISPEEIEQLSPAAFPGRIEVIDSIGLDFFRAVRYLRRQSVIGFDTESRPCFSPNQPHYGVSLLQLSGKERAFLFRIKMMGDIPKALRKILSDEKILKVGAAVNDDVRGLEKHHDFTPKSFVDLQKIVWEYGIKDKSVKKMAAIILGIRISKTQQLSNWEAEKLSEAQQSYAATDAWVCREMYLKLLSSEKNPLTPEQMLPNPPKNVTDDKDNPEKRQG
ncbi:MAG: 3'-5' exonuclease domain-containing protein 2 [Bacteroidales bacterium]|jgi:ribonuclease D|nr:3'-5' exonuclease domain-containing protein 2 [Bacteroidales bacterium]MEE3475858.1 3'-5' exonuclease [Candidatus Cryptobacteroides sp.]MBQ2531792.1 3'-5' exonuclease domain-containing protein 2 [Bacteroidales bacterium]MBQ5410318.1 3'-5' exonuclease domain-containing protein 2 [Bacteroidales bacterium]MBQ5487099.1 3'-5' exonuclease domain-containing protein 2 [Bacteroidales bacterium]